MARKLAGFLILLSTWLPAHVLALGVGNIELKSYLNQPLDARIPVLSAGQTDLSQLRVNIASSADHARAGIDYTYVMSQLRLKVERKGGRTYIHVTTRKPFREPFLSVLIEVNWANGRLLREYTVLVDPPGTIKSRPAVVSSAPAAPARPAPRQPSAPADERYPRIPIDNDEQPKAKAAAAPKKKISAYGPTRRNDTLWKIAGKVRPDRQISVEQMMIALQRKNPNAFIGNNINRLKAGYILKIPPRDVITALSHRQARAEVRNQYRTWKQARGARPATTGPATVATGKQPGGKLRVIAPRGGAVSGKGGTTAGKGGSDGSAGSELVKAREAARASEREKAVLASRLKDMEAQLANMKKLAKLKNDQLAALQARLAELRSKAAATPAAKPAEVKPVETKPAEPVAAKPAETRPTEAKPAETKPAQPVAAKPAETRPAPKKTYQYVPARNAAPGSPINQSKVAGYKPVDLKALPKSPLPAQPFTAPPAPAAGKPAGKPSASASLVDQGMKYFRENTLMASIIGGGALLLLLLLIMLIVRRRRAAAGFQESILTEPSPAAASTAAEPVAAAPEERHEEPQEQAQPEVEQAASSYLSDFTVSGMDALDSDVTESDPLTEADVFLAYGRFQPAEAMIREAIAAEPTRNDLKMKLLEIHYQAKDADAFERDAGEFREALSADMDEWRRASEMGRELNPESSLFSEAAEQAAGEEDAFAFSEFDVPEAGSSAEPQALEAELQNLTEEGQKEEALEFDLGSIEEEAKQEEPSADIEFDLNEIEASVGKESAESSDALANELADELSEIAETIDTDEQKQAEPEPAEAMEGLGDVEEAGELEADLDEVGTKLDLARAYIDMGDPEGARSILDEVLEEGDDEQKKAAEELMGQI